MWANLLEVARSIAATHGISAHLTHPLLGIFSPRMPPLASVGIGTLASAYLPLICIHIDRSLAVLRKGGNVGWVGSWSRPVWTGDAAGHSSLTHITRALSRAQAME